MPFVRWLREAERKAGGLAPGSSVQTLKHKLNARPPLSAKHQC